MFDLMIVARLCLVGSAAFIVYTYLVYPLMIAGLAAVVRRQHRSLNQPEQKVSVVIAVHNGAKYLQRKIASIAEQTYPSEQIEIVVISDGSSDETDQLLAQHAQLRWEALPTRSGKPTALNRGVEMASGEIVVFTDVRQPLSPNAITDLVDALSDPRVGAASGELVLGSDDGTDSPNIGLYWRYEKWIRSNESRVHSTAGVTGALYAIRRSDYQPLPADTLLDDFDVPTQILRTGRRVILVNGALAFDRAESSAVNEKVRKVRTLAGNFQSFSRHRWLFNPFRNPICWQFLSHKVFRLLVPYAALIFFLSCLVLREWWATLFALGLVTMVIAAWLAGQIPTMRENNRLLSFIYTFVELNAAAVVAALLYARGEHRVTWEKTK